MFQMRCSYVRQKFDPGNEVSPMHENTGAPISYRTKKASCKTVQVIGVLFPMSLWRHGNASRIILMTGEFQRKGPDIIAPTK